MPATRESMTTRGPAAGEKGSFLADFGRLEKDLARVGPAAIGRLRRSAMARFDEIGLPTLRTEDWRFTNVAPLLRRSFTPATRALAVDATALAGAPGMDAACRLVFVNGFFDPALSAVPALPEGVVVGSLAQALTGADVETHLGKHARFDDNAFTALNTAFFRDGAFIRVPRGKVVQTPIYLVFVATSPETATAGYPRNLVLAGSASQLALVEVHVTLGSEATFTNAVTEIVLEDAAVVDHCKVQEEGLAAYHFANMQVWLGRASNFTSHYVGLGGRWVRNEARAVLAAEGGECTLNGLYRAGGEQHVDNHTVIDHAMPHCASHELYKGVLDGKAHAVFNGKIFVRPDAQKTDAKQTNQTLLLSDDATINTKPQLEIYADDVKCTHGATVGQLDAEALFYLRSRGIGRDEARALLTYAFANDILERIKIEPLRERLARSLLDGSAAPAGALGEEQA